MQSSSPIIEDRLSSLVRSIAHSAVLPSDTVVPFADEADFLAELFTMTDPSCRSILSAGYASPMAALAADHADLAIREVHGVSPFTGDPDALIKAIETGRETLYIASPNRVTGAHLGVRDISIIADAVPDGLIILDEYYFDYYGITGYRVLENHPNIILLRSLTCAFGVPAKAAGYAVAHPSMQARLYQHISRQSFSATMHRTVTTALENADVKALRIKLMHDESLRVAGALTRLGAQCRITPTDFVLIRVARAAEVAAELHTAGLTVDSLEHFDDLDQYLRYQLQSGQANEALINAFERMPKQLVSVHTRTSRKLHLRRSAERSKVNTRDITTTIVERNQTPQMATE